jgi:hypothetical protein
MKPSSSFLKRLLIRYRLTALWPEKFVTSDGVQVLLRNPLVSRNARERLWLGGYETNERLMIRQFIYPGDAVLELGASIGIVSSLIGIRIGPQGHLACVEGDSKLEEAFVCQTRLNGLAPILIHGMACPIWGSDIPESIKAQGFAASEDTLKGQASSTVKASTSIPWLNGNDMIEAAGFAPSALVIDIEGGEVVWTTVAPRIPGEVKTIIMEVHPRIMGEKAAGETIQALVDEGFRIVAFIGSVFALQRV